MSEVPNKPPTPRPPVSVIAPFVGDQAQAREALAALGCLSLQPGDQLILADNSPLPTVQEVAGSPVQVVWAGDFRSPYHARNEAAKEARNAWILFVDSDCVLPAGLLDDFFDPPPGDDDAVIAGEVAGLPEQTSLMARWARSRRGLFAAHHQKVGPAPAGIAGNLLIRRDAWEALGGFRATPAADVELCWDAQALGLGFDYRPDARVFHRDPETLRAVLRQARGYGVGLRWSRQAYGPSVPRARLLAPVVRGVAGVAIWIVTMRFERAAFKAIDSAVAIAAWLGYVSARARAPARKAARA